MPLQQFSKPAFTQRETHFGRIIWTLEHSPRPENSRHSLSFQVSEKVPFGLEHISHPNHRKDKSDHLVFKESDIGGVKFPDVLAVSDATAESVDSFYVFLQLNPRFDRTSEKRGNAFRNAFRQWDGLLV